MNIKYMSFTQHLWWTVWLPTKTKSCCIICYWSEGQVFQYVSAESIQHVRVLRLCFFVILSSLYNYTAMHLPCNTIEAWHCVKLPFTFNSVNTMVFGEWICEQWLRCWPSLSIALTFLLRSLGFNFKSMTGYLLYFETCFYCQNCFGRLVEKIIAIRGDKLDFKWSINF